MPRLWRVGYVQMRLGADRRATRSAKGPALDGYALMCGRVSRVPTSVAHRAVLPFSHYPKPAYPQLVKDSRPGSAKKNAPVAGRRRSRRGNAGGHACPARHRASSERGALASGPVAPLVTLPRRGRQYWHDPPGLNVRIDGAVCRTGS